MIDPLVIQQLQQLFSAQEIQRWFIPLDITLNENEQRITVRFPHAHFAHFFQKVQDSFEDCLWQGLGTTYCFSYSFVPRKPSLPEIQKPAVFDERYSFKNFLYNEKNQFPVASAQLIASKSSPEHYTPFLICGETGCGKTHLMQAMANELCAFIKKKHIFYGNLEDIQAAYSHDELQYAREKFFLHQAFFIEDLQKINNSSLLQDEIALLCEHCLTHKKHLVCSCLGQLHEYRTIKPEIRSRLSSGLIVELKKPDIDIRVRYIQISVKERDIRLAKDQILLLAQQSTDLRHLNGILTKIEAFHNLVSSTLTERDFEQIIRNTDFSKSLSAERIVTLVAEYAKLPREEILGDSRKMQIVNLRQICMYLCRELLGLSYAAIGAFFGGKDHSTVLYAVKKIEQKQVTNKDTHTLVTNLKTLCIKGFPDI